MIIIQLILIIFICFKNKFLMKKIYKFLFLLVLLPLSVFSQIELSADQIFERVNNSVVVILAYDKAGNIYQGSGVVLNNSSYIATNYHVCSDANRIDVK